MNETPDELHYNSLSLLRFHSRGVTWNGTELVLSRRSTDVEQEPGFEFESFRPPAEEWATFWGVLDRLRAWEWNPSYEDESVLDGGSSTFSVRRGERQIACKCVNAWPPGFGILIEAMDRLVEGALEGRGLAHDPQVLLSAAATAAKVLDSPETAVPDLIDALREPDQAELVVDRAVEALRKLKLHALPAVPAMLTVFSQFTESHVGSAITRTLGDMARELRKADPTERHRLVAPALPAMVTSLTQARQDLRLHDSLMEILRAADLDIPSAKEAVAALSGDADNQPAKLKKPLPGAAATQGKKPWWKLW
jgi:hypothetical protein